MNRQISFLLLFAFGFNLFGKAFCQINVEQNKQNKIVLQYIDFSRIQNKGLDYKKLIEKPKYFRRLVYLLGTGVGIAGISWAVFKWFNPNQKDQSKEKSHYGSNNDFRERWWYLLQKRNNKDKTIWQICKENIADGITDGVYWFGTGAVVSSGLGLLGLASDSFKQKINTLWNGEGQEFFLNLERQLEFNLEQLKTCFVSGVGLCCDREEIRDNYNIFVCVIEELLAFILGKVVSASGGNAVAYQSVLSLQTLLFEKVKKFTKDLEVELNRDYGQSSNQKFGDDVLTSFRLLNNQIVRFLNLSYSVLYDGG
jgi:hypothetical protein